MLRHVLLGTVVIAAAGCASTTSDITWTARYITRFGPLSKCLATASADQYSVSAVAVRSEGMASITMARAGQPVMSGVFTVQQVANDATDVTWTRPSSPPGGQQQIDIDARAKADRCGNLYTG
jgi:hypothetical protein